MAKLNKGIVLAKHLNKGFTFIEREKKINIAVDNNTIGFNSNGELEVKASINNEANNGSSLTNAVTFEDLCKYLEPIVKKLSIVSSTVGTGTFTYDKCNFIKKAKKQLILRQDGNNIEVTLLGSPDRHQPIHIKRLGSLNGSWYNSMSGDTATLMGMKTFGLDQSTNTYYFKYTIDDQTLDMHSNMDVYVFGKDYSNVSGNSEDSKLIFNFD